MSTLKPKLLRKQLKFPQNQSFQSYSKLLIKLCRAHKHVDGVPLLLELLLREDWNAVYALADSWASQKYEDRDLHFSRNQFAALIRKYPWGSRVNLDPEAKARALFFRNEQRCSRLNKVFDTLNVGGNRRQRWYQNSFHRMRNFITYVMGDAPDLRSVYQNADFGPGANVGVHGQCTNAARKLLSNVWTVTPGAIHYAFAGVLNNCHFRGVLIPEHGGFSSGSGDLNQERFAYARKVSVVNHNNITFVPKTAKVHRTIAIEPLLNSYLQKGVDIILRRKLLRVGIDLSDQEKNKLMARDGSRAGQVDPFVTIDLSSASDSISRGLCRYLLPVEWFEFLNSIRSKEYMLGKERLSYHKFCSMGNGFCFPLETLLFVAACVASDAGVPGRDFSVYGDDIILRQSKAPALIKLLKVMGFSVNTDKTFLDGPFRESCGADWFDNEDVRPYTLDHTFDSYRDVFKVLNLSNRNERTRMFFEPVRRYLIGLIPEKLRLFRPCEGAADTGIDSTDEYLTSKHCRFDKNLGAWIYKELVDSAVRDDFWIAEDQYGNVLMWGAVRGSASAAPFVRRKSRRTKVRRNTYSGATSLWLPAPYACECAGFSV